MAQTDLGSNDWVNWEHPRPAQRAPITQVGVIGWLRTNLFNNVANSILTLISVLLVYLIVSSLGRWIVNAYWEPIWANRKLLAVGAYPEENLWQVFVVLMVVSALIGVTAGRWRSMVRNLATGYAVILLIFTVAPLGAWAQTRFGVSLALMVLGVVVGTYVALPNRWLALLWLAAIPFALIMIHGGISMFGVTWHPFGEPASFNRLGGFLLSILLTVVGITCSFPIGVFLALGRRSNLPAIKYFCIAYIELIRGVPLVSILFMAAVLLPLFLPPNTPAPIGIVRAMVAITLFSAAYLAETVRGGLQAVPKGQYEAADALGLAQLQKLRLIVLPQALRAVIPALVGQFIGLFKDTSLVALVGLNDFLNTSRSVIIQPQWAQVAGGITREVYVAVAVVYLVFSFGMSWGSRRLERQLGVGKR